MNKKVKKDTVEDIMKKELSAVEASDRLAKLEKEKLRDKKIIAEYKEREKATARALVLYERKIKYLKEILLEDILKVCKSINVNKDQFEEKFEKVRSGVLRDDLIAYNDILTLFEESLYEVCNKIEANAMITKKDRAFISNKPIKDENAPTDPSSRFDRLKQEFAQKIGSSVNRKPGRPKKSEQSIVADIGLGKKVEKTVDENVKVENKINKLFYTAPTEKTAVSAIPQTDDSLFDFNEALNPNISLKDIMADLMTEKDDEETVKYGESAQHKELENAQKQSKIELLESGFIRTPVMKPKSKTVEHKTIDPIKKKPTFDKRFLSIQNIVKETK